jgi:hypothetical protein
MTEDWKRMKGNPLKYGHLTVMLRGGACLYIHRLVLEAFAGPAPAGTECRHLNGDASDNRPVNLAWGTALENSADTITHGKSTRGQRNPQSKLTEDDVRAIVSLSADGLPHAAIGRQFGVTTAAVVAIIYGRAWNHITGIPMSPEHLERRRAANKRWMEKQRSLSQESAK